MREVTEFLLSIASNPSDDAGAFIVNNIGALLQNEQIGEVLALPVSTDTKVEALSDLTMVSPESFEERVHMLVVELVSHPDVGLPKLVFVNQLLRQYETADQKRFFDSIQTLKRRNHSKEVNDFCGEISESLINRFGVPTRMNQ
ncbi:MAG: hypothetical protein KDB00_30045 [Planctomycetales bacterium]|nr:hypothetical protein [Planctomycetales bacterium]